MLTCTQADSSNSNMCDGSESQFMVEVNLDPT